MSPNAGEPGNQGSPSNLQGMVDAAKQEEVAAAQTTPKTQFENQFGSGHVDPTPPVAESAPGLDAVLSNLVTPPPLAGDTSVPQPSTDNLAPEQTQPVVETLAKPEPEQTPAEKLKQQIAASVDEFLEEVIKGKITV